MSLFSSFGAVAGGGPFSLPDWSETCAAFPFLAAVVQEQPLVWRECVYALRRGVGFGFRLRGCALFASCFSMCVWSGTQLRSVYHRFAAQVICFMVFTACSDRSEVSPLAGQNTTSAGPSNMETFQEFAICPFSKSQQPARESCTEMFWVMSASRSQPLRANVQCRVAARQDG